MTAGTALRAVRTSLSVLRLPSPMVVLPFRPVRSPFVAAAADAAAAAAALAAVGAAAAASVGAAADAAVAAAAVVVAAAVAVAAVVVAVVAAVVVAAVVFAAAVVVAVVAPVRAVLPCAPLLLLLWCGRCRCRHCCWGVLPLPARLVPCCCYSS